MSRFFALVAVAILIFAGAVAVDESAERSGDNVDVLNESFTPSAGVVGLDESNKSRTVYDEYPDVYYNNSTRFLQSGNYTFNDRNGTLDVVSNSELDNQSHANIDYNYSQLDQDQQPVADLTGQVSGFMPLALWFLMVGGILMAIRALTT